MIAVALAYSVTVLAVAALLGLRWWFLSASLARHLQVQVSNLTTRHVSAEARLAAAEQTLSVVKGKVDREDFGRIAGVRR